MSLDFTKLIPFVDNRTCQKDLTPQDIHFLKGYKWNTPAGYNSAARKFVRFLAESKEETFVLPATANQIYEFCYWAGRDKGRSTKQEIS
ncbi:hypothetical protein PCANC_01898 [Puccinia coronata f. sp. avenae]|uniref:Uncharacterized protein n=1 Tax=Puccinia coronata f. sp. avenae TaxID=200324 RepID=A0A2N5W4C8_9BASI|nr:hypothetical protein PCANC_01898 [Puccinia coronata f. sp. avenae]